MKNYWGTAAVIFLINLCLTGPAYAWGDGWGGTDSGVQESSGSGWYSSGGSISIEEVTYADNGVLMPDTTLYCLSGSVSSNGGTSGMIAVNDGYVNGNEAWFVGNGFVEDLGLLTPNFLGAVQFDEFAVRADDLIDTGVAYQQAAWDDPLFMASSKIFFDDYRSSEGTLLGTKEKEDVYVFSTAKVPIDDGKNTVDVPNVITKLSDLKEAGEGNIKDYGFYKIGKTYYGKPYYEVDPDDMLTQVQLEDGSAAAIVSIGQLSSVVDGDMIAVLDAGGNTWYVDEGDIEENEDMAVLYEIFTQ